MSGAGAPPPPPSSGTKLATGWISAPVRVPTSELSSRQLLAEVRSGQPDQPSKVQPAGAWGTRVTVLGPNRLSSPMPVHVEVTPTAAADEQR